AFLWAGRPLDVRSFPTRRSSDLGRDRQGAVADDVVGRTRRPDPCPPGGARRDVLQGTYGQRGGRNARDTQRYGALQGVLRPAVRSEEHTSELQSRENLVCRLLLE